MRGMKMKKTPFLTLEKAKEIAAQIPTPFHIYDEAGIRANARALKEAFAEQGLPGILRREGHPQSLYPSGAEGRGLRL